MKALIKKIPFTSKVYNMLIAFLKAYFPKTRAKLEYKIAYGTRCNLDNPTSFSEKLLWLSLNTYRNNPLVLKLCDKYLVREYVKDKIGDRFLNELYYVFNSISEINFDQLPDSFALKVSQGCTTNLFCRNKSELSITKFESIIKEWNCSQGLYDKMMADIGGVPRKRLKKYYICEKYLIEQGKKSPTDYKIYCFNGVPKAILVISDRFEHKTGLFMSTDWDVLSELSGHYKKPETVYKKPHSLSDMLWAAKELSQGFPFVRVDMYEIDGKAIFGEMTFFPNGCVHPQETSINGKSMGQLIHLPKKSKNSKK